MRLLLILLFSFPASASWWCAETAINAEKATGAAGTCYSSQGRCEDVEGMLCLDIRDKDLRKLMVQGDELVTDPVGEADAEQKDADKALKKAAKDAAAASIAACDDDFDSLNSGERDACLRALLQIHR